MRTDETCQPGSRVSLRVACRVPCLSRSGGMGIGKWCVPSVHASASREARHPGSRVSFRVACLLVCAVWLCVAHVWGADVVVETIDGTVIEGEWLGVEKSNAVRIGNDQGQRVLAFDELSTITFARRAAVAPRGAEFILSDGSRLPGEIVAGAEDGVDCKLNVGADTTLTFEHLAGVRFGDARDFPRAAALFEQSLLDRPAGHDILISRSDEKVRVVPGRIDRLDAQGGSLRLGEQLRSFRLEKVFGIVFAKGSMTSNAVPLTLILSDGSRLGAEATSTTEDAMMVTSTAGFTVRLPLDRIQKLTFHGERVVFLGDLPSVSQHVAGILHRSWPVRIDRSVANGPIQLNGRKFDKGLGVHSRTEIIYDIDGAYERFAATIGIDDFVRPGGNVVFRVIGDGRVLFESGEITGRDEPRAIRVNIVGVKIIALLVDFGEELDLSDHADWADARLIRPAAQSQ